MPAAIEMVSGRLALRQNIVEPHSPQNPYPTSGVAEYHCSVGPLIVISEISAEVAAMKWPV